MNEVWVLDTTTMKEFTKEFENVRQQRLFMLKCKHSKTLIVTGYTFQDEEEEEYLSKAL